MTAGKVPVMKFQSFHPNTSLILPCAKIFRKVSVQASTFRIMLKETAHQSDSALTLVPMDSGLSHQPLTTSRCTPELMAFMMCPTLQDPQAVPRVARKCGEQSN